METEKRSKPRLFDSSTIPAQVAFIPDSNLKSKRNIRDKVGPRHIPPSGVIDTCLAVTYN
jgi:hypothetical protein